MRQYQVDEWGSSSGETAVIELSALRARNLSVEIARFDHREERVLTLRQRVAEHKPVFVVCYGLGYRDDYEQLAGAAFDKSGFVFSKGTVFAITKHPTSFGCRAEELLAFGRDLKRCVEAGVHDSPEAPSRN